MITGGMPPRLTKPCSADDVYTACSERVLLQNAKFYARFPMDIARVGAVVRHLAAAGPEGVITPAGNTLRPRCAACARDLAPCLRGDAWAARPGRARVSSRSDRLGPPPATPRDAGRCSCWDSAAWASAPGLSGCTTCLSGPLTATASAPSFSRLRGGWSGGSPGRGRPARGAGEGWGLRGACRLHRVGPGRATDGSAVPHARPGRISTPR